MTNRLRLTGGQVRRLHAHLFQDGKEAVAIAQAFRDWDRRGLKALRSVA